MHAIQQLGSNGAADQELPRRTCYAACASGTAMNARAAVQKTLATPEAPIEFETNSCGHAVACKKCAMKMATGGKCKESSAREGGSTCVVLRTSVIWPLGGTHAPEHHSLCPDSAKFASIEPNWAAVRPNLARFSEIWEIQRGEEKARFGRCWACFDRIRLDSTKVQLDSGNFRLGPTEFGSIEQIWPCFGQTWTGFDQICSRRDQLWA